MQVWGLNHNPQKDGRRYFFDLTIPAYWSINRRDKFAEAIKGWPTKH